jgi:hypothetical protein
MTHFNEGPPKLREHLNETTDRLGSMLNYNLRGDGYIEVHHIAQGQTLRLNIAKLLQVIGARGAGGSGPRKGFASTAAPASGTIACYLDTDGVGDTVNVVCEVAGGTNLNAALPRLADGTMISVWNDNGTWRSVMTFQASGDC